MENNGNGGEKMKMNSIMLMHRMCNAKFTKYQFSRNEFVTENQK